MGQSHSVAEQRRAEEKKLRSIMDGQIEAELALKSLQFAQKRALDLAERRDRLNWEIFFAASTITALLFAGSLYKRKDVIVPIIPLTLGIGYHYDMAYGEATENVKKTAETLLKSSTNFDIVGGGITLKDLDEFRAKSR